MLDFDSIQNALEKLQAVTDASEAHGTLCGLLLGQQEMSKWLKFTLDVLPEKSDLLAQENLQILHELFEQSKQQLYSEDMSLELLLPDDGEEFAIRLLGLSNWCQGFLYGLAVNGEALVSRLSGQGKECLEDLLEISQLGHDEEETDDSESVYAEIVEHVRLSVIYMNEDLNPIISPAQVH